MTFSPTDPSDLKAAEIAAAWNTLETFGYPPEAVGWPFCSVEGLLPEAIECALGCLIRQRNDLLNEVIELRKLKRD